MDEHQNNQDNVIDNYLRDLKKWLDLNDLIWIRKKIENQENTPTDTMDCIESSLRIFFHAYGKAKDFEEVRDKCNNALVEYLRYNRCLETIEKYFSFCEKWKPKDCDFGQFMQQIDDINVWIRASTIYWDNQMPQKGHELIELALTYFPNKPDRLLKTHRLKHLLNSLKELTGEHMFLKANNQYKILVKEEEPDKKFYEELLLYIGEIYLPVSQLNCLIYEDIGKNFPKSSLARLVAVFYEIETMIINQKVISFDSTKKARDEASSFIKANPDYTLIALYFSFVDRIYSHKLDKIDWFELWHLHPQCFSKDCKWYELIAKVKRPVLVEVLQNAIGQLPNYVPLEAIPLFDLTLKTMVKEKKTNITTVFTSIWSMASHSGKEELNIFRFDWWKKFYHSANSNIPLSLLVQMSDKVPHLEIYALYHQEGIRAARDKYSKVPKTKLVVEYMLDLELKEYRKNIERINACYRYLSTNISTDHKEEIFNDDILNAFRKWAQFEFDHTRQFTSLRVAMFSLLPKQYDQFYEEFNMTRFYFTMSKITIQSLCERQGI